MSAKILRASHAGGTKVKNFWGFVIHECRAGGYTFIINSLAFPQMF
jgi:hypothetical protein